MNKILLEAINSDPNLFKEQKKYPHCDCCKDDSFDLEDMEIITFRNAAMFFCPRCIHMTVNMITASCARLRIEERRRQKSTSLRGQVPPLQVVRRAKETIRKYLL